MITAIVVDDESLARKQIKRLLTDIEEVVIVGVCENGKEAVDMINQEQPDLIFLDIQMPGMDGFDVIDEIEQESYLPGVIFLAAHEKYAFRAFEVHAIDYLLKPFDEEKFTNSVERAIEIIQQSNRKKLWNKLDKIANDNDAPEHISRIMIKDSDRIFFMPVDDIDWVESAGNYVRIHAGNNQYLLRETMTNMEKKLDPDTFYRVHRSTIINLDKVKELEPWFHGDYQIIMETGKKLTLSRNYKELLQKF